MTEELMEMESQPMLLLLRTVQSTATKKTDVDPSHIVWRKIIAYCQTYRYQQLQKWKIISSAEK